MYFELTFVSLLLETYFCFQSDSMWVFVLLVLTQFVGIQTMLFTKRGDEASLDIN